MARRASSLAETRSHDVSSGVVVVVDDDPAVRTALRSLIQSVGLQVEAFASAHEFLAHMCPERISCLVLDVRLPGKNGLDLHDDLKRTNIAVPVVFITGYGDIAMSVRAMKAGAVEFLPKPFCDQDLIDAIHLGIEQDRERQERQPTAALREKYATLTSRERQVMARVGDGLCNKVFAIELGISEVTVNAHRRQVMVKIGARTLADLIRMSDLLRDLRP